MKICIYGAGAVGCWLACELAAKDRAVSMIARGATLSALHSRGATALLPGSTLTAPVNAVEQPSAAGAQDLVVIAVKSTAMGDVARAIGPLLGPHTVVLSAMNGLPWWFFEGVEGGDLDEAVQASVDEDGKLGHMLEPSSVVGAVIHGGFVVESPGVVRTGGTRRVLIGDSTGTMTDRAKRIAALFRAAETSIECVKNIQREIWFKLLGNMTVNPISALCESSLSPILDDGLVTDLMRRVMSEAAEIGQRLGIPVLESADERIQRMRDLGNIRTSMLQDLQAGRPMEIDAILGSVRRIGHALGMSTPFIDALLGLVRLRARQAGLYAV